MHFQFYWKIDNFNNKSLAKAVVQEADKLRQQLKAVQAELSQAKEAFTRLATTAHETSNRIRSLPMSPFEAIILDLENLNPSLLAKFPDQPQAKEAARPVSAKLQPFVSSNPTNR